MLNELLKALEQIRALKPHPVSSDDAAGEYCNARNDAALVIQEIIDNLDHDEPLLSSEEKIAQASRCSCHGSDDYCPCQNSPDRLTKVARAALEAAIRSALVTEAGDDRARIAVLEAGIAKALDPSSHGIGGIESAEDAVAYMAGVLLPLIMPDALSAKEQGK